MNYHGRIMNIPADVSEGEPDDIRKAYKIGHKHARHAAAEIAVEADAVIAELLEALEAILNDHRRTDPHHEHLCPLCLSASASIAKAKS